MPPPQPFAAATYLAWHDVTFPADAPLGNRLETLRTKLTTEARDLLKALAQIMTYTASYCRREYELPNKVPTNYDVPLSQTLLAEAASGEYDLLFKSTASIINKLWRKNIKATPEVHLGNLREQVRDLVRTDIAATTLHSAKFLAERMNALPGIIVDAKVRKTYKANIASIRF